MIRGFSLRTRLFLIVLLGAVLPLAVVGVWLARSAERAGEELLRERLDETLRRFATDIGDRWVTERSELMTLSEHRAIQAALQSTDPEPIVPDEAVNASCARLEHAVDTISFRDERGRQRTLIGPTGSTTRGEGAAINVTVYAYARQTGRRIGAIDARIRVNRLIPVSTGFSAGAGTIVAVIDRASGASVLPVPFDPALAAEDEFRLDGERWIASRRSLQEPALDLVVAAPVTSFAQPFQSAGRRGLAGLAAVSAFVLLATTLLTRQTTRSLRSLDDAATAIAQGDYDRTVPVFRDDEVGRVTAAFNTMSRSLRRTLHELAQRQSLAAVGEFAASLAHEVRNPLTSIRIDLQRLEEKTAGEPRLADTVRRALRAVARLDATVTGALQVARSGRLTLERVDLRDPIDTAINDVESECRDHGIALTHSGDAPNTYINGDRSALHQLFLNLFLNAAQAIESNGNIHIAVEGGTDAVCVSISDTGTGMPADVRERIFDPFFSTKPHGSGLGLPIAQRIVAGHGGEMLVDSEAGRGTTIKVQFPIAPQS